MGIWIYIFEEVIFLEICFPHDSGWAWSGSSKCFKSVGQCYCRAVSLMLYNLKLFAYSSNLNLLNLFLCERHVECGRNQGWTWHKPWPPTRTLISPSSNHLYSWPTFLDLIHTVYTILNLNITFHSHYLWSDNMNEWIKLQLTN